MAHTCSQDLEADLNTLQSNFIETQQEVKQLSANVDAINTTMQSSITTSIEEIRQDMTTHLESVVLIICTKLHIPAYNPLSYPPPHIEAKTSSHSHNS
jgi:wobble nucleotide-excising tRNase